MNQKSVFQLFFHYTSRSVLSMLGLSLYILADTYFIANGVGAMGIAALNIALPMYSFISGTGLMLGMGGATRYCILQGENRKEEASICFTHALLMGILIGLLITGMIVFFASDISVLLGADETVLPYAKSYLQTIGAFSWAFVINQIFVCFVRNDNQPSLAMAAMLTGSISNVILDYIFIFPLGMGMFGAALATGLAPLFSMMVLSIHYFKKQNRFHIIKSHFQAILCKNITALGISSFITEASSGVIMAMFNFLILGIAGSLGVAAYGIIANLALVVVAIYTGVAQGIQPIVSLNCGLQKWEDNRKVLRLAIVAAFGVGLLLWCAGTLYAEGIVALFNKEQNVQLKEMAVAGILLYFPAFVIMGINIVSASYLGALSKALPSFIISIMRGLMAPVIFAPILAHFLQMNGIYLTILAVEAVTLIVSILFLRMYVFQTFHKEK